MLQLRALETSSSGFRSLGGACVPGRAGVLCALSLEKPGKGSRSYPDRKFQLTPLHLSCCHTEAPEISQNNSGLVENEFRIKGVGVGHNSLTELSM